MTEALMALSLLGALFAYALWEHKQDRKKPQWRYIGDVHVTFVIDTAKFTAAMEKASQAINEMGSALRKAHMREEVLASGRYDKD